MSSHEPARSWMLVLCYAAFLGFIPLLVEKRRRELRWHARNGLLLFGAVAAFGIAFALLGALVPSLSCVYVLVMFIVGGLYVVVAILAVIKAFQGERLILPGLSRYAGRG